MHTIGVVSDTHGMLRPEALRALEGAELIVHAGDVGSPLVLEGLSKVAPVVAVRGNTDCGAWAAGLPLFEAVEVGGLSLYVLHNLAELDIDPAAGGFAAVVYGHSHRPAQESRAGVLYFNPGGAGARRFDLPASVGRLTVQDAKVRGEIVILEEGEEGGF